jgi:hypothetical protein
LVRFEYKSGIVLFCFSFTLVLFGESHLLVSWCAGGSCSMACSDEDHSRSRKPGAEDWGWSHRSSTRWSDNREVGWSRVQSAPGMWRLGVLVSWLSLKTKVDSFSSVWASKPMATVCEWFGLKTTRTVSHQFGPQNRWRWFVSGLAS